MEKNRSPSEGASKDKKRVEDEGGEFRASHYSRPLHLKNGRFKKFSRVPVADGPLAGCGCSLEYSNGFRSPWTTFTDK